MQGKSVLHTECTDHNKLIDIKIKPHSFLHLKLVEYAEVMDSIDINKDAISYLRTRYDVTNIFYYIGSAEDNEYPYLQVGHEVNPRSVFISS